MTVPRLVLASANQGKLQELKRLFGGRMQRLETLADHNVSSVPEPHTTFIENALTKARAAAIATNGPALADDSGLCVDHLGGRPGVRSARYAGDAGDVANNELLLHELNGIPAAERQAHYHCTLVLMRHGEDPAPLIAEGRWEGVIATRARGAGGFGYDPIFALPDGRTAAQLSPADKDELSHRALAARALLALL